MIYMTFAVAQINEKKHYKSWLWRLGMQEGYKIKGSSNRFVDSM